MILRLPSIDTSALPEETRRYVRDAYREVQQEPRVGIIEERNSGTVPILPHRGYEAGFTEIKPYISGRGTLDTYATRIGINTRSSPWGIKRITKHELRHVLAEALRKYMDVGPRRAELIMESYAEYGGMKAGSAREAADIAATSPYPGAIWFGVFVDKHYVSDFDNKPGYEAFIRDIQLNKSAAKTIQRLFECRRNHTMEKLKPAAYVIIV